MTGPFLRLRDALERFDDGGVRVAGWRITWVRSRRAEVGVRDGRAAGAHNPLTLSDRLTSRLLVRWSDGRVSRSRAGRAGLERPDHLLVHARAGSYDDPDAARFAGAQRITDLLLFSSDVAAVTEGRLAPLGDLLALARDKAAASGFRNHSGAISASARLGGVSTSEGCDVEGESTLFSYSIWFEGLMGDGLSRREVIPVAEASERLDAVCDLVGRLGTREASFAGGEMPVLLHPRVAEPFVSSYLIGNLSGERIWNARSAFTREQVRDRALVAREDLSVRLEPLRPLDAGSFRFTSEGLASRPLAYLSAGRLTAPILNLKYAHRFGMDPVPAPAGIESLAFDAADRPAAEEAIGGISRGLLVLGVLGLHTQDAASGEFSVSAPQCLAIGTGRLAGRVRAGLTGNVLSALRSPDLRLVDFPGQRMPGLLFPATVSVG